MRHPEWPLIQADSEAAGACPGGVDPAPGPRRMRPREGGTMQDQKLPVLEKIGFGAGDMAVNVVISSMMLIITFFYTDVYGLKPAGEARCTAASTPSAWMPPASSIVAGATTCGRRSIRGSRALPTFTSRACAMA